jgi:hypothetical protein
LNGIILGYISVVNRGRETDPEVDGLLFDNYVTMVDVLSVLKDCHLGTPREQDIEDMLLSVRGHSFERQGSVRRSLTKIYIERRWSRADLMKHMIEWSVSNGQISHEQGLQMLHGLETAAVVVNRCTEVITIE